MSSCVNATNAFNNLIKIPLSTFEIIILIALGLIILLLIFNIYLINHYYTKLNQDPYDYKFERQILQPPLRHSTTNDFASYYEDNLKQSHELIYDNNNNSRCPNRNGLTNQANFEIEPFQPPTISNLQLEHEQEQFGTFPVYYLPSQDRQPPHVTQSTPHRQNESPLKPLADYMNNRTREYRERLARRQVDFRIEPNLEEMQIEEEGRFIETREVNTQVVEQQTNKFMIREEKSIENLTIVSEMKRSKSWDINNSKNKK